MAPDEDFLAPVDGDETTVGAGVDQIEPVVPPFDTGMLPGSLAVVDDQLAAEIPADGENRGLFVEQEGLAAIAQAKPTAGRRFERRQAGQERVPATLIARPMNLEQGKGRVILLHRTEIGHGIGCDDGRLGQSADQRRTAQNLVATGDAGDACGSGDGRSAQPVAFLEHFTVVEADADGQLQSGNRRQVGNPLLHVDRRLAGIFRLLEGSEQFVADDLHGLALVAVDRALHAFQAAFDGMHRFLVAQPFKQRRAAGNVGKHHDQSSLLGAHWLTAVPVYPENHYMMGA